MDSSDTIIFAMEYKRKNRQPESCVRHPFKDCDGCVGCVKATLGTSTVTLGSMKREPLQLPRPTAVGCPIINPISGDSAI